VGGGIAGGGYGLFSGRLFGLDGAGEVGADAGPVEAAVDGLEDVLVAEVKRGFVDGGEGKRRGPGIAVLAGGDLAAEDGNGPGGDVLREGELFVPARDGAVAAADVNDVGVLGIDGEVAALAAAGGEPVARCDLEVVGAAGDWSSVVTWYICAVGWLYQEDQVLPRLRLMVVPWSVPRIMREEALGSTQSSW
jgi:hypothetical protein